MIEGHHKNEHESKDKDKIEVRTGRSRTRKTSGQKKETGEKKR